MEAWLDHGFGVVPNFWYGTSEICALRHFFGTPKAVTPRLAVADVQPSCWSRRSDGVGGLPTERI